MRSVIETIMINIPSNLRIQAVFSFLRINNIKLINIFLLLNKMNSCVKHY